MLFNKNLKKILVCGSTLLMIVGIGANANNISAHRVHHRTHISRITKRYNSLIRYVNWVKHYNHTHKHNWKSYKLDHLNKYENGLSKKQRQIINNKAHIINKKKIYHHKINWYQQGKKDGMDYLTSLPNDDSSDDGDVNTPNTKLMKIMNKNHANKSYIRAFIKCASKVKQNDMIVDGTTGSHSYLEYIAHNIMASIMQDGTYYAHLNSHTSKLAVLDAVNDEANPKYKHNSRYLKAWYKADILQTPSYNRSGHNQAKSDFKDDLADLSYQLLPSQVFKDERI